MINPHIWSKVERSQHNFLKQFYCMRKIGRKRARVTRKWARQFRRWTDKAVTCKMNPYIDDEEKLMNYDMELQSNTRS